MKYTRGYRRYRRYRRRRSHRRRRYHKWKRRALTIPRRRAVFIRLKFENWNSFWISQVPPDYTCDKVKAKELSPFYEWVRHHWSFTLEDHINQSAPPSEMFQYYKITKAKLSLMPTRSSGTSAILNGFSYIDRVNLPLKGKVPHWETGKWFPEGTNNYTKRHLKTTRWHSRIFRPTPMLTSEAHDTVIPSIGIPGLESWWFQRKNPWITIDDWAIAHLGLWTVFQLDYFNQTNPPTKDSGDTIAWIHTPAQIRMESKTTVYVTFRGQI